jgi:transcriptional regulator with XRE-family HTH domain
MKAAVISIYSSLAKRRADLKLTQAEVAQRAGIPQTRLSLIEKGGTDVRVSTLQEIARALGLEPTLVPTEALPTVQAVIGQGLPPDKRRLFEIEPD